MHSSTYLAYWNSYTHSHTSTNEGLGFSRLTLNEGLGFFMHSLTSTNEGTPPGERASYKRVCSIDLSSIQVAAVVQISHPYTREHSLWIFVAASTRSSSRRCSICFVLLHTIVTQPPTPWRHAHTHLRAAAQYFFSYTIVAQPRLSSRRCSA